MRWLLALGYFAIASACWLALVVSQPESGETPSDAIAGIGASIAVASFAGGAATGRFGTCWFALLVAPAAIFVDILWVTDVIDREGREPTPLTFFLLGPGPLAIIVLAALIGLGAWMRQSLDSP